MTQSFGNEDFTIRCELDPLSSPGPRIGSIVFELAGEVLGDFDQPCVIARMGYILDATLAERDARKDLFLARLEPAATLEHVYARLYGPEAEPTDGMADNGTMDEGAFWYTRFTWVDGEPFDGFRTIMLSVPAGYSILWDHQDGNVRHHVVPWELYYTTVIELLAWLHEHGVGDFSRSTWMAMGTAAGIRAKTFEKAHRLLVARENRAKKLALKNAQRAAALKATSG